MKIKRNRWKELAIDLSHAVRQLRRRIAKWITPDSHMVDPVFDAIIESGQEMTVSVNPCSLECKIHIYVPKENRWEVYAYDVFEDANNEQFGLHEYIKRICLHHRDQHLLD